MSAIEHWQTRLWALLFLGWCVACLGVARAASARPNLILIMTDQQSAEAMSCCLGSEFLRTPAMDKLAAGGVRFTRAYAANPLCVPSRNAIFTGRYPHQTGVMTNDPRDPLDHAEFPNLGSYFKNAGYETAYYGKWHLCYDVKRAETHGFETVSGGRDTDAASHAVEFLARKHERPFLLVVSFLNPHNICEWSRRLAGREQKLSEGEIGSPPVAGLPPLPANLEPPRNEPDGMTLIRRAYQVETGLFPVGNFADDDWRKLRWGYYQLLEKVDAELQKVFGALEKSGIGDNTAVLFTSDHGECAGAHRFNQKTVLYEESARVPLIFFWPGKTTGGSADHLINTGIDILPTLLECAGIAIPGKLPGRSLLPLALKQPVKAWRDYVVVENQMVQTGVVDGFRPTLEGRMLRGLRYKYYLYGNGWQREMLVDLDNDPGETVNLAVDPKFKDVLVAQREVLARFGVQNQDPAIAAFLADNVKPIAFPTNNPPSFRAPKRK